MPEEVSKAQQLAERVELRRLEPGRTNAGHFEGGERQQPTVRVRTGGLAALEADCEPRQPCLDARVEMMKERRRNQHFGVGRRARHTGRLPGLNALLELAVREDPNDTETVAALARLSRPSLP